jgi:hypothetical protein
MAEMEHALRRAATRVGSTAMLFCVLGLRPAGAAPPSNDDIGSATAVVEPLPFFDATNTVEATSDANDPDCFGNGPTVWYVHTPSVSGFIGVDTFGSDYDTTLSAYTGLPGSLTQIACNDDAEDLQSRIIIPVTAGTIYRFMVGAYASGPGGSLSFAVDTLPPPADVHLTIDPSVQPSVGTSTVRVQADATSPVLYYGAEAFLVQASGRGTIAAAGSAFTFKESDSFAADIVLKDLLSLKKRGTGFVGGRARLQVYLYYRDPLTGEQVLSFDQEVVLKGR